MYISILYSKKCINFQLCMMTNWPQASLTLYTNFWWISQPSHCTSAWRKGMYRDHLSQLPVNKGDNFKSTHAVEIDLKLIKPLCQHYWRILKQEYIFTIKLQLYDKKKPMLKELNAGYILFCHCNLKCFSIKQLYNHAFILTWLNFEHIKRKKNFTSIFYMHLIQSKMNCQIKLRIGFSWNQYHL